MTNDAQSGPGVPVRGAGGGGTDLGRFRCGELDKNELTKGPKDAVRRAPKMNGYLGKQTSEAVCGLPHLSSNLPKELRERDKLQFSSHIVVNQVVRASVAGWIVQDIHNS